MVSKEETLRQLQMADLGTLRRERISTDENTLDYFSKVTVEELEKTRLSNTDPAVKRVVEANLACLARWNNLYKEINDDDGEALDPLMDGQSHRARLQAQIRASGGQVYVADENKKPNPGATGGDGNGHTPESVVHSHARKDSIQTSRRSSAALMSKSRPSAAQGRPLKKSYSRLDPALSESKRGFGIKAMNKRQSQPSKTLRAASEPQPEVPLVNPESFMESVRRQFSSTKKEPDSKLEPDTKRELVAQPVPSALIHDEDDLMVFDSRSQPSSSPVKHKRAESASESEGRNGYKTTCKATELARFGNIPQPPSPVNGNAGLNGTEDLLLDFSIPNSGTPCAPNPESLSDRASAAGTNSFGSALGSRGTTVNDGRFSPCDALVRPPEKRMDEDALFDYIQELSVITDSLHLFTGEKAAKLAARREAVLGIISKTRAAVSADAGQFRATNSTETSSIRAETPDNGGFNQTNSKNRSASTSSKAPSDSSLKKAVNAPPFVPQSTCSVRSTSSGIADHSSIQNRSHELAETPGAAEVDTERSSTSASGSAMRAVAERKASRTGTPQPEISHQQTTPRKGLEASRWAGPSTTQSLAIRASAPSLEQSPSSGPKKMQEDESMNCTEYWQRTLYTAKRAPNIRSATDQENTRPDCEESRKSTSRGKGLLASRYAPKGD